MIKSRIIDLKEPIKIIGLSVDTDVTRIYHDAQQLIDRFEKYKKENEIPNKR